MGALTDNRKRRAIEQRLLFPLAPDSPPPPSKKSKLSDPPSSHPVAMELRQLRHRQTQQSPPSSDPVATAVGDQVSSRPRFPPPALRRPVHAPQRILTAFGLGSGSRSENNRFDREFSSHKKDVSMEGTSERVESRGLKRDASFLSTQTERDVEVVDLSREDSNIDSGSNVGDFGSGLSHLRAKSAASIFEENGVIVAEKGSKSKHRIFKSWKKASGLKSGLSNIPKKCLQSELGFSEASKSILNSELESSETLQKMLGSELVSSESTVTTTPEIERPSPSLEQYKKLVSSVSNYSEVRALSKKVPLYKELYDQSSRIHDSKLKDLEFEVKLAEKSIANFKLLRDILGSKDEDSAELFTPLTDEEEEEVKQVLNGGRRSEVLVAHEASNIEITREKMQCLRSGAWLNDEVINVYLELLKERERREPKKFLNCHFFNTFFYKKLAGGRSGYDFKAVRRWTTQRKLGYALIDCDKIFVPIHKEVHWCLAVINVRDKKLQYLDSLGGMDTIVLRTLARYFTEEVKEKSGKQIDTSSWDFEDCPDLPLQENGWDCGMFMLKYVDFLSRDLHLSFSQEHMMYFRKRTVKELMRLQAF
ncbi:Sentrin-specific protease [Rhynchospora pubera]|uniref:Sentrin-specific protease n=1 Tax=Rhynchospora pubera TaxID=906938 RepID=A0AAV8C3D5_9POAL|nr:Sentrin-specific protease [Rhynchospora pubera]